MAGVLHVCTRYQRGGSERRIRDIVRSLPELEHVLLVGADSDVELARSQTGAASVEVLPGLVRAVSPAQDAATAVRLRGVVRRLRPDVVVTHQSKAGALGRVAARTVGVPVVHSLSMASFGPGYGRKEDAVFRRLERALGRVTSAYCVVGQDLADAFAGLGVDRRRLHVVRSGVPLPASALSREQARREVADRYGVRADGPLLVYVGSLEPRKNVLDLPQLLADLPGTTLLVLGDGVQRADLAAEVAVRGLHDRVHLAGHVADPALVHTAMRAADAVVLLSSAEGLPQVLLQAAVLGTPFVAYDVDGVRELLHLGARGETVPLGDRAAATAACARVLQAPQDGDRSFDAGSWAPEEITRRYRSVFGSVLQRDLGAPPAPAA